MKQIILFCSISLLFSCKENVRTLPYYDTADFTPKWEMKNQEDFHKVRDFSLTDQEGLPFNQTNIANKICVVDFFFTSCPGICPRMAASMGDLQKEFINDNNVLLLSHSVTPEKDSVPVLKNYAESKNVNYNKWKLLTGTKSEIYNLGRKFYFVEEDLGVNSDTSIFLHTENFVLIDKQRRIRGIYNSLDNNSMAALKSDIKVLEKE